MLPGGSRGRCSGREVGVKKGPGSGRRTRPYQIQIREKNPPTDLFSRHIQSATNWWFYKGFGARIRTAYSARSSRGYQPCNGSSRRPERGLNTGPPQTATPTSWRAFNRLKRSP